MDWFENDEAIAEFMGVRHGFTYDDHKTGFARDLDWPIIFGEESSSTSQDPDENDNTSKNKLDDLPSEKESFALLLEKIEEVNIAGGEIIHNIHSFESLNLEEKDKFIQFF